MHPRVYLHADLHADLNASLFQGSIFIVLTEMKMFLHLHLHFFMKMDLHEENKLDTPPPPEYPPPSREGGGLRGKFLDRWQMKKSEIVSYLNFILLSVLNLYKRWRWHDGPARGCWSTALIGLSTTEAYKDPRVCGVRVEVRKKNVYPPRPSRLLTPTYYCRMVNCMVGSEVQKS